MNLAHLHLLMNHIPIIGIPVALAFLTHALWTRNVSNQRFSLMMLFGLAAIVLPVYLTGEPAEELVEHLPGVSESLIESHEDAAQISLILTLLTGAVAFIALWLQKNETLRRQINLAVLGIAFVALVSLSYTANLGGKIRHSELRGDQAAMSSLAPEQNTKGDDDDDD